MEPTTPRETGKRFSLEPSGFWEYQRLSSLEERKMRVAILGQNIQPPWNEAVKNMAFELARQLCLLGHDVHLITDGNREIVPVRHLEVHSLPSQGFGRAAIDK